MRGGIQLGKILGIDVRVDWSWLLIMTMLVLNLQAIFSAAHAEWAAVLIWGLAVVAALLFFGSVLAHELAHSLMAQARGISVRGITLHLFGGVSDIQEEPSSPGSEFVIAVLGPVTSLTIGGLLLLIARVGGFQVGSTNVTELLSGMGPVLTMLGWLGSVNVSLGLFNLIPGFPLDGGRVLRSILWALTRNLKRATRWAVWVGQLIAWAMILTGVAMAFGLRISFLGTGLGSGLWLAFIGWFLHSASTQSMRQVAIQDVLEGVPVSQIMRRDPPTCSPGCTVFNLVYDHILGTDDHAFPVLDGDRLVGVVSLEDVREIPREDWGITLVATIMTPIEDVITTGPDEEAALALRKLTDRDVGQLPVVDEGRLVGLLRRHDIVRFLQLHADATKL